MIDKLSNFAAKCALCQATLSTPITACRPVGTLFDINDKCFFIMFIFINGAINALVSPATD